MSNTPEQIQQTENTWLTALQTGRGHFDEDQRHMRDHQPTLEEVADFLPHIGEMQVWLATFKPTADSLHGLGRETLITQVNAFATLLEDSKADFTQSLQKLKELRAATDAAWKESVKQAAESQRTLLDWERTSSQQAVQNVEDQWQVFRDGRFPPLNFHRPGPIPIWVRH